MIPSRPTAWPTGSAPGARGPDIPASPTIAAPKSASATWPFPLKPATSIASIARTGLSKKPILRPRWSKVETLEGAVKESTSCICFFGGDPGPQLPYALRRQPCVAEEKPGQNSANLLGDKRSSRPSGLREMIRLSVRSGGCVKIDLKAWDPGTHRALCGFGNSKILDNFARAAEWSSERESPPALVASTPLVPGYIDEDEVYGLASFIARINPDIPYALLGFAPEFLMDDSPTTSNAQAQACLKAAKQAGLTRVRLGNEHLLC